jgi:molybdopterin molybdotransferase
VLVSSAGVSVGDLDLVREALARAGAELHLWQVSMRPGKPITFGTLGSRPMFGLPGNPVSAMVTFELFVRPALLKMSGRRRLSRPRVRARALEPIANPGSRRGYLRVHLESTGQGLGARLTGERIRFSTRCTDKAAAAKVLAEAERIFDEQVAAGLGADAAGKTVEDATYYLADEAHTNARGKPVPSVVRRVAASM